MNEHDTVVLKKSLPDYGLEAGDIGAIVHVYQQGAAFEVEFVSGDGSTLALTTLVSADIRPISAGEVPTSASLWRSIRFIVLHSLRRAVRSERE